MPTLCRISTMTFSLTVLRSMTGNVSEVYASICLHVKAKLSLGRTMTHAPQTHPRDACDGRSVCPASLACATAAIVEAGAHRLPGHELGEHRERPPGSTAGGPARPRL